MECINPTSCVTVYWGHFKDVAVPLWCVLGGGVDVVFINVRCVFHGGILRM